jgi:CubicO group peptidase (beta-lactamase class C family)
MREDDIVEAVDHFLEPLIAADEFSGALLVAHGETPIYKRASGFACQRYSVPNRIDTKFNLGSMGKMFTGLAVAQLAEQQKVSFHDPIGKHLPDYHPREIAEQVTLHHLLTHTSGMGTFFNERIEAVWADLRTLQDYVQLFRDDPLAFEPGSQWRYSNVGYLVLGLIIEQISGQSYFEYVKQHVYEPAGMQDTDAYEMDYDEPNLAIGYTHVGLAGTPETGPRRNNLFMLPVKGTSAGGGYSTVEDMLKLAQALRSHTLLGPTMTELVFTGKVAVPNKSPSRYGYGFVEDHVNGTRISWHNGGAPGINARFDLYRDLDNTVVVLSNYDLPIADRVADQLREILTAQG